MGSFKPTEEKEGKCVKKCQTVIIALHTIATMFQKPRFICHAKLEYTKICIQKLYIQNCILKIDLF